MEITQYTVKYSNAAGLIACHSSVSSVRERQLVIPCDYLVFPGNSGYAEQVLTGNVRLVMQMYGPMITKHTMQTPLLRAREKKKRMQQEARDVCARGLGFWCALGIKGHITRICHVLIEQSHQTRLSRWKW